jgi:phage terminase large subunit GpA-like protein
MSQTREQYNAAQREKYKIHCPYCGRTVYDPDHPRKCQRERAMIYGEDPR